MLKKLAKYGNSTALVIDKAILELLNISEGDTVKLQTDGRSLIISPVHENSSEKVSYSEFEALGLALSTIKDRNRAGQIEAAASLSSEQKTKIDSDLEKVFAKYNVYLQKFTLEVLNQPEFQAAVAPIAQQYDPIKQSIDFISAYNKVKYQFVPELEEMDRELARLNAIYSAN